ncbi:MAG TPA: hypothetical protein VI653_26675 [Steroidobacteraceae bacterium]
MMRVLVIGVTLLLGLIGLGMSLCGGGVLIMSISSPGPELGSIIVIPIASLLLGFLFVSLSVVILRKKLDGRERP